MDEYIKREDLLQSIDASISYMRTKAVGSSLTNHAVDLVQNTRDYIAKLPAADVAPVVHGRWEERFFTNDRQRVCSVCFCTVRQPSYDKGETSLFKYCPHCGARMDGEG